MPDLSKCNVLIVDDTETNVDILVDALGEDYEISVATDGKSALEVVESDPPDLILLDIMMPDMDGYEVCAQLKENNATKNIPVIFLTVMSEDTDETKGLELGAVDYITKPINIPIVKARVKTHLNLQKKTEQLRQKDLQLIEMDRIAGIGTLAAGIAHEINNPLSFVKSSIWFLKKSADKMVGALQYWDDKPVSEPLMNAYKDHLSQMNIEHIKNSLNTKYVSIQSGIERIMKIVNNLKRFSRVDMETSGKVDINQSVEDAVEILCTPDTEGMEFIKELREIPVMECSPNEINQCLLHALKNAVDAVDNNGKIRITTSYDESEDQIMVRIIDNGKGMSPEVLRQTFNLFFTTKAPGSGTGIGLSLTERIIKRHGGKINISSKEGEGTTVTMIFLMNS